MSEIEIIEAAYNALARRLGIECAEHELTKARLGLVQGDLAELRAQGEKLVRDAEKASRPRRRGKRPK